MKKFLSYQQIPLRFTRVSIFPLVNLSICFHFVKKNFTLRAVNITFLLDNFLYIFVDEIAHLISHVFHFRISISSSRGCFTF